VTEEQVRTLRRLAQSLRLPPGKTVTLPGDFDPRQTGGIAHEADARDSLDAGIEMLAHYQARLAAQNTYGLLVVLQGLDAAGKDGAIKHVARGINPQGVHVSSFKVPSAAELSHDFLWRYARELPSRGGIAIFNRSHYEEVLVVRVHPENLDRQHLPADARGKDIWARRYREINDWERYLVANGIHVVKLFLNISKAEQRERLLSRIDDPDKNWKFSMADVAEREHWEEYQHAYAAMLSHTSTSWAPWHVVPADHKWFARLSVAAAVVTALAAIDPRFPVVGPAERAVLARARKRLEAETG
jgi:PPK2 family polyphosphate:nucleotide phosphotransferase